MPYTDEQRAAALETSLLRSEHMLGLQEGEELPINARALRILQHADRDFRLNPRDYQIAYFVMKHPIPVLPAVLPGA